MLGDGHGQFAGVTAALGSGALSGGGEAGVRGRRMGLGGGAVDVDVLGGGNRSAGADPLAGALGAFTLDASTLSGARRLRAAAGFFFAVAVCQLVADQAFVGRQSLELSFGAVLLGAFRLRVGRVAEGQVGEGVGGDRRVAEDRIVGRGVIAGPAPVRGRETGSQRALRRRALHLTFVAWPVSVSKHDHRLTEARWRLTLAGEVKEVLFERIAGQGALLVGHRDNPGATIVDEVSPVVGVVGGGRRRRRRHPPPQRGRVIADEDRIPHRCGRTLFWCLGIVFGGRGMVGEGGWVGDGDGRRMRGRWEEGGRRVGGRWEEDEGRRGGVGKAGFCR